LTGRRIIITKHAGERIEAHGFTPEEITRAIHDGERILEGRRKARYRLRTKKGILVAICIETTEEIHVITVTRGKRW
jgi:hypothetical protein